MNKDLRLARKGAPTGFGHGRRHSCLGYVPKLCILLLFFCTHIHERECSYMLQGTATHMAHRPGVVVSLSVLVGFHCTVFQESPLWSNLNSSRENRHIFVHGKTQAFAVLKMMCKSEVRVRKMDNWISIFLISRK